MKWTDTHLPWLYLVGMLICMLSMQPSLAETSKPTKPAGPKVYTLFDGIRLTSAIKYTYGDHRIVIKSVFPQLESDELHLGVDYFNQTLSNLVSEGISQFKARVLEAQSGQKELPKKQIKNNLYIDYAAAVVSSHHDHLLSIRLSFQEHIAGKRTHHYHRVLNYHLEEAQEINLRDLFIPDSNYLEIIADYSKAALTRHLANETLVSLGTLPTEANFANWNIKSNGLLFTFDTHQVAPRILGTQTVLIPFAALKEIIGSDTLLADCIKKKKRCLKKNLLTGGFIDEAAVNTKHRRFNPILSAR